MKDIYFLNMVKVLLVLILLINKLGYSQCPEKMSNNAVWIDKDTFDLYVEKYIISKDEWTIDDYVIVARISNTIIQYYDFGLNDCEMPESYRIFLEKAKNSLIMEKLNAKMVREGVWYSMKHNIGLFFPANNKNSIYYWIKDYEETFPK